MIFTLFIKANFFLSYSPERASFSTRCEHKGDSESIYFDDRNFSSVGFCYVYLLTTSARAVAFLQFIVNTAIYLKLIKINSAVLMYNQLLFINKSRQPLRTKFLQSSALELSLTHFGTHYTKG